MLVGILILVSLIGSLVTVSAFDLIEITPIHSKERWGAKIDGQWLLIDDSQSSIHGYYTTPVGTGCLVTQYNGYNTAHHWMTASAYIKIDSVEKIPGADMFSGIAQLTITIDDKFSSYDEITIDGFHNYDSKQLVIYFYHDDLGLTFVSFENEGIEVEIVQSNVTHQLKH